MHRTNDLSPETKEILEELIEVNGTTRPGSADANEARATLMRAMKKTQGAPDMEPLSRKFRRLTRELMVDEELQRLLKERIIGELTGQFKDTRVTCAIIRVAAGNQGKPHGTVRRVGEQNWVAPSLHVHLEHLSDEQLKQFYEQGVRPQIMQIGDGQKTIDIEE